VKPVLVALVGAYGVHLVYTSVALGWRGLGPGPALSETTAPRRMMQRLAPPVRQWLAQAGLHDVRPADLLAVTAALFIIGAALAFGLFGGPVPTLAGGAFAATAPVAVARARRERRLAEAREMWPRLIEEIRLLTATVGRSIPQALFDVGRRGPAEFRAAFSSAEREWLLSTDFARTVAVLKRQLADPTADAICETLLIAHEVGGTRVERCLTDLIEDRVQDLQGRKDALAKQAGARFARWFVLVVPLGMALVGLSIGDGRAAYRTGAGQIAVASGVATIVACWLWAGRLMRLPSERRVFT
jgi:tight adherence protein B